MKVSELSRYWDSNASTPLSKKHYEIRLPAEDLAKLKALAEMYPGHSIESLITDLLSAALGDLEASLPYVEGKKVIATDEFGDPVYEDAGQTPVFMTLTKKHLRELKASN